VLYPAELRDRIEKSATYKLMMPTIRISDQTYERLKQHVRPFEDKPEDIIVMARWMR